MSGWIKLHRQITDWEWYTDHNTFRVFLHLLLTANHKDKKFKGMDLKAGTIVTSRDLLAYATGLSVRQIRTALDKLKTTNELTIKTSPQGTIIQIVNYVKYQIEASETTNKRPTSDQQTTSNKNVKNNKEINIPSYSEFLSYALEKKPLLNQQDLKLKYESWIENDWCTNKGGKMQPILKWKATLLNTLPYIPEIKITAPAQIWE